jgi:hypothetical protein
MWPSLSLLPLALNVTGVLPAPIGETGLKMKEALRRDVGEILAPNRERGEQRGQDRHGAAAGEQAHSLLPLRTSSP